MGSGPVNRQSYREWKEEQAFWNSLTVDDLLETLEADLNESKQRQRNHDRTMREFRLGYLEQEQSERIYQGRNKSNKIRFK